MFFAPAIASFINGAIFAPLELACTLSKSINSNKRSFSLLTELVRKEGVSSLWRGSSWFILSNGFSRGSWLYSYNRLKQNHNVVTSGILAGIVSAMVTNPFWALKSYAQLPGYPGLVFPSSPTNSKAEMLKNRKLTLTPTMLTVGTVPSMIYVAIESVTQLMIYEAFLSKYQEQCESVPLYNGLIGGLSRTLIIPWTYPLHVVTLRMRENRLECKRYGKTKSSLMDIIRTVRDGRAWYHGCLVYSCRIIPQSTMLFGLYSYIK
jgi:hypothetical protein